MTNVPWVVDAAAVEPGGGPAARARHQRPRGDGALGGGARAVGAGGPAAGDRAADRQRRGDRGRHRARRSAPPQPRRPVRAGRIGRRARRLGRADAARDRDARDARARLRPLQRRARHLRSRPGEHLPVHARRVRQPDVHHAGRASCRRAPARASASSTIRRICRRRSADRRSRSAARSAWRRSTMFVAAYGAEAGNLALRTVATAGVYVGGGIAPKILPALEIGLVRRRLPRESADGRRSSRRFRSPSSSIPRPVSSAPRSTPTSPRDTIRAFRL